MNIPALPMTMARYTTDMGRCMVLERLVQFSITMRVLMQKNMAR